MPALPTNLIKIGSVYKYRSRIPKDLLRFYKPKKEITETLNTKSLSDAKRLLPAVQLKYQQEWANLRAALNEGVTELPINDTTIQYLTAAFDQDSLGGDEQSRLEGGYTLDDILEYRERLSASVTELKDAAAIGDVNIIKPALGQYLQIKCIKVVGSDADYRRLALGLQLYLSNSGTPCLFSAYQATRWSN